MTNKKSKKSKKIKGNDKRTVMALNPVLGSENRENCGDVVRFPTRWLQPHLSNQVYGIKRIIGSSDISAVNAGLTVPTYQFKLADCPNVTEFSNLFDQYRFVMVRMIFRPRFNYSNLGGTNGASRFFSVIDYDDMTALAALNDARQYQSLKETRFDQDHVRCIVPRMAVAGYTTTFTGFVNMGPQWISIASNDVNHYGIKVVIETGTTGSLQTWAVELEYYLEFRQTK